MRLGAQVSIAGGIALAFDRGQAVGCETIMIFTKSNRQWQAPPLKAGDVAGFFQAFLQHEQIYPVAAHASYLINLGSHDEDLWQRSFDALKDERLRAAALGIPLLTFHPGAAVDGNDAAALDRIARGLAMLLEQTEAQASHTTLCLETMAGQGSQLGHQFAQLATIISLVGASEGLGVCFDTCHVFAAGYDIRTQAGYEQTMAAFDEHIGLERLRCFHLNDSVHPLGSRKDRHAHIGEGEIGRDAFAALVNDPRWQDHPAHLETPKVRKDAPDVEMDPVNLQVLRSLISGESPA